MRQRGDGAFVCERGRKNHCSAKRAQIGADGPDFKRSHTGLCDAGVQHEMADVGRRNAGDDRKKPSRKRRMRKPYFWSARRTTVFAVICRRSQKSVTATTQRFLSMKHMDRTSIFPNSFLSAHWKVVRMPARRVSTKRRVPLHRAPSYHSVLAVSMRQEWPPICRWYRVHRRPTF